jgi:hypothetical protein
MFNNMCPLHKKWITLNNKLFSIIGGKFNIPKKYRLIEFRIQGGYSKNKNKNWNRTDYLWIFKVNHCRSLFPWVDSTHSHWVNSNQSYLARSCTCIHCPLGNSSRHVQEPVKWNLHSGVVIECGNRYSYLRASSMQPGCSSVNTLTRMKSDQIEVFFQVGVVNSVNFPFILAPPSSPPSSPPRLRLGSWSNFWRNLVIGI